MNGIRINVNNGTLQLVPLSNSAIRVRYTKANIQLYPEEIVYTENTSIPKYKVKEDEKSISLRMNGITAIFNKENETISFLNDEGRLILEEQTKGRYLELDSLEYVCLQSYAAIYFSS